ARQRRRARGRTDGCAPARAPARRTPDDLATRIRGEPGSTHAARGTRSATAVAVARRSTLGPRDHSGLRDALAPVCTPRFFRQDPRPAVSALLVFDDLWRAVRSSRHRDALRLRLLRTRDGDPQHSVVE